MTTTTPLALLASLLLGAAPGAQGSAPAAEPGSPAPAATAASAKDPAAMSILKRMCDRLQAAKTYTIRGRASLAAPLAGGGLATFFNDFDTAVRRPDGLAAHRKGDLPEVRFAYDGKSMTVHAPGSGKWATASAPATMDAMLVAADEQAGVNLPFDEFLVADPCAAITAGLTAAVRAPQAVFKGKAVEHLVLSSAQLHLEYWIDPGTALPVRTLVIYVDQPQRPHFLAEIAEWKVGPKLPASTFALPKPKGAVQVDLHDAASAY